MGFVSLSFGSLAYATTAIWLSHHLQPHSAYPKHREVYMLLPVAFLASCAYVASKSHLKSQ